jgi:predicted CXXCH cytochrome family protein
MRFTLFFILFSQIFLVNSFAQVDSAMLKNMELSQKCLKCHGHTKYQYKNVFFENMVTESMCLNKIVDTNLYYEGVHKSFKCTDCHSEEYSNFPHDGMLRMEPAYACIDCHGGDENFAKYNFEGIEEEFNNSVHSSNLGEDFSCWMCHDPHTYKLSVRSSESFSNMILYNNMICLSCHSDISKYELVSDNENPNILETHDWLPNQQLHFKEVRCLECHTNVSEDVLVSHQILPKEDAVKNCTECHSSNSKLEASLYRYLAIEERSEKGFIKGALFTETFIVGANQNTLLNKISIIIFILLFGGLLLHAFLRIVLIKK